MSSVASMFKGAPSKPLLKQIYRLNLISGASTKAYKLDSSKYKTVELMLALKSVYGPAAGLKKFWRENLPALKFHNEDVNFVVTRVRPNSDSHQDICAIPNKIIVHDASGNKSEIDCKGKHASNILRKLVQLTNAEKVADSEIPRLEFPNQY